MTDEGKRKPPPRFPLPPRDEDIVEIPPTHRGAKLPPHEPFRKLAPSLGDIGITLGEVLAVQRKQALQLDGFGQAMNRRFDLFHEELALQRADGQATRDTVAAVYAVVTGDHAPRLDHIEVKVEEVERTTSQKAKAAAMITARFGAWGSLALLAGGFALRALAKLYPQYGELIEGLTGLVGL